MKPKVELSLVGTRWQVRHSFRKIGKSKDYGMTSNLKLTRVGFRVWHLHFDVEINR